VVEKSTASDCQRDMTEKSTIVDSCRPYVWPSCPPTLGDPLCLKPPDLEAGLLFTPITGNGVESSFTHISNLILINS